MPFGLIILGDEILSGRRQDQHLSRVIEIFRQRGLALQWAQYLGDERAAITALLQRTMASGDVVFCCGGIGATPDDHTRQAAAYALDVPLMLHPQAAILIGEQCAIMAERGRGSADMTTPENQQRLKMGEFPAGALLIPNPINRIPGFSIDQHYFVPGFPEMAWPMIEWVLDTRYADLFHQRDWCEMALHVYETPESLLTPLMEQIEREFTDVKVFSLPNIGSENLRRHIELGVKGPKNSAQQAYFALRAGVHAQGCEFLELVTPVR